MSMRTDIDSDHLDKHDDHEMERVYAIERSARAYRDAWMDLDIGNEKDPKVAAKAMVDLFIALDAPRYDQKGASGD